MIFVDISKEFIYDRDGVPYDIIINYKPRGYHQWMREKVWKSFKAGMLYVNPNIKFIYSEKKEQNGKHHNYSKTNR